MALTSAPNVIAPVGATLGEGPVWIDGALWFVDIKAPCVYCLQGNGKLERWPAPAPVGWVLPATGGGLLAGLKSGIHHFDPASGGFSALIAVELGMPDNRLNDAVAGPDGALWFGSMDDREAAPSGRFYRYAGGQLFDTGLPGAVVTNGPAISPDGRTLYVTDTFAGTIGEAAINDDGSLGPLRPFVAIDRADGYPDGPTVDAQGHVWTGLFGGWSARRYDPAGVLVETIRFPVANVTKIAFGGPALTTAYATTAKLALDADALAAQPLAGHLFAFDAGVAGVPVNNVQL
ncbi:MAG: SMP-30/gluconolactonase/LRE family protein [Sphingomonas sp.]